jgi:hypothetical protein
MLPKVDKTKRKFPHTLVYLGLTDDATRRLERERLALKGNRKNKWETRTIASSLIESTPKAATHRIYVTVFCLWLLLEYAATGRLLVIEEPSRHPRVVCKDIFNWEPL